MDILNNFNYIKKNNTRDGFHDSTLIQLIINLDKKEIIIEIEHFKNSERSGEEKIVLGRLLFKEISYINLNNDVECFGVEDEISSFDVELKNGKVIFNLIGIKGWVFSFIANFVEYTEKFKSLYKY